MPPPQPVAPSDAERVAFHLCGLDEEVVDKDDSSTGVIPTGLGVSGLAGEGDAGVDPRADTVDVQRDAAASC